MTILFIINIVMSMIFLMMSHPLSMGLILLIQTITISMITGNMSYNFWFSYILFLVLIGGMLILFMYMTSIASNEKFKMNNKLLLMMLVIPIMLIIPDIMVEFATLNYEALTPLKSQSIFLSLNKYINFPMNMVLTFTILYLLLTMIATVKISNFKMGSLRQMN